MKKNQLENVHTDELTLYLKLQTEKKIIVTLVLVFLLFLCVLFQFVAIAKCEI